MTVHKYILPFLLMLDDESDTDLLPASMLYYWPSNRAAMLASTHIHLLVQPKVYPCASLA